MVIQENFNLKALNTFGLEAKARYFARFSSVDELRVALGDPRVQGLKIFCLGGGSNTLFVGDFDGLVLRNEIHGLRVVAQSSKDIIISVGAGVIWHDFVLGCIGQGWGGLENLSLIPGTVGAAPIQNIGAYGVEVKDVLESVEVFERNSGKVQTLLGSECRFGYRDSIFKHEGKDRWIVLSVNFRLKKNSTVITHYGAIETELKLRQIKSPTLRDVSEAVMHIRRSKLPDPAVLGNAGSFFKNPVVTKDQYHALQRKFPQIVGYADRTGFMKVPAGWLIEHCGFKGYTEGLCGVHKQQALVLVNYGGATGRDILDLAEKIVRQVQQTFGIELEKEINILQ